MTKRIRLAALVVAALASRPSWPVAPPPPDVLRQGLRQRRGLLRAEDRQRARLRGLPEDRRRQGRRVHDVVRRLRRPVPRRRRWPARRRRAPLPRARRRVSSTRAWSTRTGTRPRPRASSPTPRSCSWSARATPAASRPGTTWSSRASRSSRPNPASSGSAKWNILAAWAHVSGQGGTDAEAQGVRDQGARQRHRPARAAAATPWRRSSPATATSCSPTRTTRSRPRAAGDDVDYILPDDTLLIENPVAADHGRRRAAKDFLKFQLSDAGQTDYAQSGFRPVIDGVNVDGAGRQRPEQPVPGRQDPVHDRRDLRRLGQGQHRVLRRARPGSSPRSSPVSTSAGRMTTAVLGQDTRPVGRGRPGVRSTLTRGSALGLGIAMIWFSLLVLIPLAASWSPRPDGWQGYVDALTNPQTWAAIKLTVGQSAPRHRAQRRHGHADRLGAGPRPVLGQAPARRRHRHPVRDAHDRRRPGAARALRPEEPARRQRRQHRDLGHAGAGLRHPAVHRPDRPAGARRARRRRRGGRGLARREAVRRSSAGSSCPRWCRRSRRGRPVVRPGDLGVRLPGAAQRQPALQDRGRLGPGADASSRAATRRPPPRWPRSCSASRCS